MCSQIVHASTSPQRRVFIQQLFYKRPGRQIRIHPVRKSQLSVKHLLINRNRVLLIFSKWNAATEKLEQNDSDAPKICSAVVAVSVYDLRGHVVGGADDGEGAAFYKFCGAEVDEFWEPFFVDHDVFGFEVAVYDVALVEMVEDFD